MSTYSKTNLKRPALTWAFLFLVLGCCAVRAQADPGTEKQSSSGFYESEWKPFSKRLTDENSLKIAVAGVLSTAATHQWDEFTRSEWKNHQRLNEKQAEYGDFLGTGIPGLLVLSSQYFFDRPMAKPHLRALLWGNVFTYSIKLVASRKRPGDSHSYQSFPSGHTSTTFASATILTYSYGWKAAVLAFPLAVYTGASRVADDAHWLSDVVAGAYVGFLVARASNFADESDLVKATSLKSNFHWWPDFYSNSAGIQIYYIF